MRVLLLGAGASKAYDASPTHVGMPLAADFFPTFESLAIAENPWVLREGLIGYLKEIRNVDPESYLRSGIDIESLHSDIAADLAQHMKTDPHSIERVLVQRAYNELIFLFAATINEIQNGPPSDAHVQLATRLAAEDVILTFNWDTLMDRALSLSTNWTVESGYGVAPAKVFRDGWSDVVGTFRTSNAPKLLKLHGSTNWLVGHPAVQGGKIVLTQLAPPEQLRVYENATRPYSTYAGRYMPGYEPFSYGYYPPNLDDRGISAPDGFTLIRARLKLPWKPEGTADDSGLVSIPLIIPPIKAKTYDLFGTLFATLWGDAQRALTVAETIIVVGYSFPNTDVRTLELFKNAFGKRSSIPRVIILDPFPQRVIEMFQLEFGIIDSHLTVYREYFTAESIKHLFKA